MTYLRYSLFILVFTLMSFFATVGCNQSPLDSVCKYTSENSTYKSYSSPIRYNFLPLIESLIKVYNKSMSAIPVPAASSSPPLRRLHIVEHVNICRGKDETKRRPTETRRCSRKIVAALCILA